MLDLIPMRGGVAATMGGGDDLARDCRSDVKPGLGLAHCPLRSRSHKTLPIKTLADSQENNRG